MPVCVFDMPGVLTCDIQSTAAVPLPDDWTAALHEHLQKHVKSHFNSGKAITSRMLE